MYSETRFFGREAIGGGDKGRGQPNEAKTGKMGIGEANWYISA